MRELIQTGTAAGEFQSIQRRVLPNHGKRNDNA
jgi:hypothetical protein